jgi:hypothetical protein
MSATPQQPPPPTQGYDRPYYGAPLPLPSLNGELVLFLLAWLVAFIVTLAADDVAWSGFLTATVVLAAAYMISRGIAKAGKVFESR